jgi:nicotinamide mononucleotide transporter PnuC
MITYMFMTAPMALLSLISWLRHPYKGSREVTAERLTVKNTAILAALTLLVTFICYFILKALGNASLVLSTVSIATTFAAAGLTFLRSPLYALGYGANDVVLILLWILASLSDPSSLPMVTCFTAFLANDLYGFINWKKMAERQDV